MDWKETVAQQVAENPVMIYMRGTRESPRCGFSARVINVFNQLGVPYQTEDMDQDRELWNTLAQLNNWPTSPQIYIKGEFVGGADIVMEMYRSGELIEMISKS
jgi:monothiol glutaredoxin